jgi:hypothetical protein
MKKIKLKYFASIGICEKTYSSFYEIFQQKSNLGLNMYKIQEVNIYVLLKKFLYRQTYAGLE